jgi:hypothetical protein
VKLYIAGPMRGYADFNHPAFDAAAAALRAAGHDVVSPAERDRDSGLDMRGMAGTDAEMDAVGGTGKRLAGDLVVICTWAEGIALLDGHETSLGAVAEVATARAVGISARPWKDWLTPA